MMITARNHWKTVALAFGEFSWRPDLAREINGDFDKIVGRPLKEDEDFGVRSTRAQRLG